MKLAPNQFFFYFLTTDVLEEEEVLVFPVDSLISEFGGALELFLGFFFLGLLTSMPLLCRSVCRFSVKQYCASSSDLTPIQIY